MRILLVLICSFALVSLSAAAQEDKKKEKKGAQAGQVSKPSGKKGATSAQAGKPVGGGKPATAGKPAQAGKPAKAGKPAEPGKPTETGKVAGIPTEKGKGKGKHAEAGQTAGAGEAAAEAKPAGKGKAARTGKPGQATTTAAAGKAKPFKQQKFNLASKSKPPTSKAPAVSFQQGKRIEGSQNWQGSNYQVFRNYKTEWHDRNWWHNNSSNVVFIFGGWYALNNGWWYPAWGYAPNSYYFYNGPIYAYNNLPPDQVIANVQAALQGQGYYRGEVDGLLGPLTREALANYQRDHGLYLTSSIDRPTLASLGMG